MGGRQVKRVCSWCPAPHVYGQAEPLDDPRETHGMCEVAAKIANERLDVLFSEAVAPPSAIFFAPHVVETSPINDRLMTKPPSLGPIRPEWPRE